jgi:hypothetical protein
MKKDVVKKHHFWFLLGAVPLLIGILFILLMVEPADAVEEATKKYDAKLKETSSQRPPGKGKLDELDKQKAELEKRRDDLWKSNYERQWQTGVLQWPRASRDPVLEAFEKASLPFGFRIVDALDSTVPPEKQYVQKNDEIQKFTGNANYFEAYKALAESLSPTLYERGSWTNVLRYVTDWKNGRPPFEQFWLALEDFWVQKALLAPIREVNESIARFDDASAKDATQKFLFKSRIWELNIELAKESGATVLKSRLKNRTDRVQMLGAGKSMKLKVWLDDPATSQPFEYRIEGESVKGNEEITPRFVLALHRLPAGTNPNRIWKVEQVFDATTVPVRLVRRVDLGYADSKRSGTDLKPPKFMEDPAPEGGAGNPGGTGAEAPPASLGRGGEGGGSPPAFPGTPGTGTVPGSGPKTGTHDEVLLGNKKRYLEANEQIRRMPVAVVVVVDQAYLGDLLVAYANSPLRFHTTQVQMQRFRESLPLAAGTAGSIPGGTGSAPPAPIGRPGLIEGAAPATAGGAATPPDNQATAGLVEVAIYGIVTFYEKYTPKATAAATTPAPGTAAPAATTPTPKTTAPTGN